MSRFFLHPLPLRIWHWLNALIVLILIGTGLYLRWKGIAALPPHHPFLEVHKVAGLMLVAATAGWLLYTMPNKQRKRQYRIGIRDLPGGLTQLKFYLWLIFKGEQDPFQPTAGDKYNPLQRLAYDTVMFFFLPALSLTGLLFLDIPLWRPYLLAGNLMVVLDFLHVLFAYLLLLYLICHLYMATLGKTFFTHTRAMLVGYEDRQDAEQKPDVKDEDQ